MVTSTSEADVAASEVTTVVPLLCNALIACAMPYWLTSLKAKHPTEAVRATSRTKTVFLTRIFPLEYTFFRYIRVNKKAVPYTSRNTIEALESDRSTVNTLTAIPRFKNHLGSSLFSAPPRLFPYIRWMHTSPTTLT